MVKHVVIVSLNDRFFYLFFIGLKENLSIVKIESDSPQNFNPMNLGKQTKAGKRYEFSALQRLGNIS